MTLQIDRGAAGSGVLTREAARSLVDRVLAFRVADEMRVVVSGRATGNTRFADGSITTSGQVEDTSVTVWATIGRRRGGTWTNSLDDASLKRTAELAATLARLSPEDPELMPELGPQQYSQVEAFVDRTAALDGRARSGIVRDAVAAAAQEGKAAGSIFTAGYLEANARIVALGNSRGLFAYHRTTDVDLSVTARTPDGTGSGWAHSGARDAGVIDPAALGRMAARKSVNSRTAEAMEPGPHTAVLEPQAVNDLVPLLIWALNARTADEGRSPFSRAGGGTRVGERVADERVTLYSDPADPHLLGQPFDFEGLPVDRRAWIENGVLRNLWYTRFWAEKQGQRATGTFPLAGGLALSGGTRTTEELIAGCERGVLVTHFFYIRQLDPRTALQTGLTRDGTFLIENGRVTRSLKNFRWNESPLLMLSRIDDIGRPEPTAAGRLMPALRIRDFNFTSLSDAV